MFLFSFSALVGLVRRFWPAILVLALALAMWGYVDRKTSEADLAGYNRRAAEENEDARRRLERAARADEEARRCAADPVCRNRSDPYERKDDEP